MNEVTRTVVIDLKEFIDSQYSDKKEQARYMANSARTNIMLFKATSDIKYDIQARLDIEKGYDILRGFTRPLGCIFTKAA